jgi:hypothetical protein
MINKIVPSLITKGSYEYPSIGASIYSPISSGIAKAMGLNSTNGVLVADIIPNGPAEKGGLKGSSIPFEENGRSIMIGGDVITKLDSEPVVTTDDFINYIQGKKSIGDELNVTLIRGGQIMSNFSITLDALSNITFDNSTELNQTKTEKHDTIIEINFNRFTDSSGNIHTIGEIQNISTNKTLTLVEALISFYDAQGMILGTDSTFTNPSTLRPGGTATYDIVTSTSDLASSDFAETKISYSWIEE